MININASTNNVINNNFLTELKHSENSNNKNTFLNLLTSNNLNKNTSDYENNSDNELTDLNTNNEIPENINIFQNDVILMINNCLQNRTINENYIGSNLIKEDMHKQNENKVRELNSVNTFLQNNESTNINNCNLQINKLSKVNLVSFNTKELLSSKDFVNQMNNLNLNKDINIKVHEQYKNNDIANLLNTKISLNELNNNYSEFKSTDISVLNKLLNSFDIQNIKVQNVQNVIGKNNFDTENSNNLKNIAFSDIINNKNDSKKMIINNNDVDNSDLAKHLLKNNLFESKENTSKDAKNLSSINGELNFKIKKLESDNNNNNTPQNYLSSDVNTFNKIIEIADESNLLKSGVTTQIKDKINLMYNEKTSQVTMKLSPENLGKIDIILSYNNDSIKLEITSFNNETNRILNSSVNELISSLKNNTEKLVEVIIKSDNSFSDKQFNFNQSSENNYQNEKERKNKYIYLKEFVEDEEKNEVFKKLINL